ncbi:MAG: SelB C-terminal domain-containing protein [Hyphomicrobiaceae bacterium]
MRTIHALGKPAQESGAGERAALNLAGLDRQTVARGTWLVAAGQRLESQRFDVNLRLLASEKRPLRTWSPVHLHLGTSEIEARLVLLETDTLAPGATQFVQVVANEPLPVRCGDRFVVRDAGAERTIGGGSVLDPAAPQRFRRTPARLENLAARAATDPLDRLERLLALEPGIVDLTDFVLECGMLPAEADALVELLEPAEGKVGDKRFIAAPDTVTKLGAPVEQALANFHEASPERPGMAEDRLRLAIRPRLTRPVFKALLSLLAPAGKVVAQGGMVRLASHTSSLGAADQRLWDRIEKAIDGEFRFRPPQVRELSEATGQPIAVVRKLLKTMARLGVVVEVATDRFFLKAALLDLGIMAGEIAASKEDKMFTAAEFRDRAGSGRNVGIQILEHFDRRGLTLRKGDARRVVKDPAQVFGGEV